MDAASCVDTHNDASYTTVSDAEKISRTVWIQLILLAVATFIYCTFELFPVGLITSMAEGVGVGEEKIGLLVGGYAVVAAIITIPSMQIVRFFPRKFGFILSLVFLTVAEFMTACASNYPILVASRVIAALTHGIMWSLLIPIAASLVSKKRIAFAASIVYSGVTLAYIIGSPLSTFLGGIIGWRLTALFFAVCTIGVIIGLIMLLPRQPSQAHDHPHEEHIHVPVNWGKVARICLLAVFLVVAHFISYTYFAIIINNTLSSRNAVIVILTIFGIAGAFATFLTGRYSDTHPGYSIIVAVGSFFIGVLLLFLGTYVSHPLLAYPIFIMATTLWGAGYAAIGPSYQSSIIRASGTGSQQELATSIYITCYQIGIASGSIAGTIFGEVSIHILVLITVVISIVSLASTIYWRKIYE